MMFNMTAAHPIELPTNLPSDNPFASASMLPYELPDFTAIRFEHYRPALLAGMAQELMDVEAIVANPDEPTIANTLEAFELAGAVLDRVEAVFFNQSGSDTTDELQELEEEIAPLLAAHHDEIYLNRALFDRLEVLYARREEFDPETAWVLKEYHQDFVRAGVLLDDEAQAQLRALNERITSLMTAFDNRLLRDTNASAVHVLDVSDLAGLPDDAIAAAREAAAGRGLDGFLLELQLPSAQPIVALLDNAELRARVQLASETRGLHGVVDGEERDTRSALLEIVKLRAERAELLGYEHHAASIAEESTAKTTEAVMGMLSSLAPRAVANARVEAEALAAELGRPVAASDWSWTAERVRKARYNLDDAALRPYFELETVLHQGVFYAASRLYGLSFVRREDLVGYHPDVQVFEVFNEDGSPLGLFLGDYFTRESKRGGAWMNNLVDQSFLSGQPPVVVNNLNISRAPQGQPTLLTFDEVGTMFHEFGHALHGLFSHVNYPSASGTNVPRDFVEYPSQVNEMWSVNPEVLGNYARHYITGEPLAAEVIETIISSAQFNEGFATTEYLGAALLDQAWHQLTPNEVPDGVTRDVATFEAEALATCGLDFAPVPPRYRSSYFQHIFSGGYSAAYYSYIWSEVLDADTVRWFGEQGGLRRESGDRFREVLLARGGGCDPMEAYRELLGREPDIEPLLVRRGLTG